MIKKLLILIPVFILSVAALDINSNSAPASSSGAPDEKDCSTAGCHATYAANSGPGSITVQIEGAPQQYVPGKTYTISVEVNQPNINRFGFQLLALNQANDNAGTLSPIDYTSNQVVSGYGDFASRKYITYTYKSTEAITPGTGKWYFKWTAPTTSQGKITFYAAGIAADNNGNDAGDYTYTKSISLEAPPAYNFSLSVFPNPINSNTQLYYSVSEESNVRIELLNALGQNESILVEESLMPGKYSLPLVAQVQLAEGLHFVRFIANNKTIVKKIIINK